MTDGSSAITQWICDKHTIDPGQYHSGGGTYRIIADHLGSPRLVIATQMGAIAQRLDYDAFGNVILGTNPGFQPFGFAGGLDDLTVGLIRFGLHDYDPQAGRWTTKDPLNLRGGDTNLYTYVNNNPQEWVDVTDTQFI